MAVLMCGILYLQVYGWEPEPYPENERPDTDLLGDRFRNDYVGVTCEGEVSGIDYHQVASFLIHI